MAAASGDGGPDWAALPAACLARGLALLPPSSAAAATGACACTCVGWRPATHDEALWRAALLTERPAAAAPGGVRASSSLGMTTRRADSCTDLPLALADAAAARAAVRAARESRARMMTGAPTRTRVLSGHTDFVRCLALQDGHWLLSAASSFAMRDCSLRLWDVRSSECAARLTGHTAPIWAMDWRGGHSPAVTGSGDGTVGVWDVESARQQQQRPPLMLRGSGSDISMVALDADGRHCAAGYRAHGFTVWRLRSDGDAPSDAPAHAAEVALHASHTSTVTSVQLSTGGEIVAVGRQDGYIEIGRVPPEGEDSSGANLSVFEVCDTTVSTLSFDEAATGPLADVILVGTSNGLYAVPQALADHVSIDCFAVATMLQSSAVTCHQQGVAGSDAVVAVGDQAGAVTLCDARMPTDGGCRRLGIASRIAFGPPILALHACGHALAVGAADGNARMYDLRALGGVAVRALASTPLPGHTHRDRLWALHLDEQRLITAGLDHDIAVRDWF
jgi:hypothetical protein